MTDKERCDTALGLLKEIVESDVGVIEQNPDEGNSCFFCGAPAGHWMTISKHEKDCVVLRARALLDAPH